MNINEFLIPIMNTLLVAFLAFVGKEAIALAPTLRDFFESKLGIAVYEEMMKFGIDAWNKIEEDNRLGDLVLSKAKTFEQLMLKKFPQLDGNEINFINKAIAGELNKDKSTITAEVAHAEPVVQPTVGETPNEATAVATENDPVASLEVTQETPSEEESIQASAPATNIVIINGVEYAPVHG